MEYKFDKNNKDKIGSLLSLKDKCSYYEKEKLNLQFNINNNNWKFIYYHSFFSLVKDVSDLSLFFLINEEVSNSIERKPYPDLIIDIIKNKHYKEHIIINKEKITFDIKKIKHTMNETKELLVWKVNGLIDSQLFDFSNSIFSAFEFWISELYKKFAKELEQNLIDRRKEKYIKLINSFTKTNGEEKDNILIKLIKLQGLYISFPDKLNYIFKIIDKEKYTKNRAIKKDKELIDFLRASRNTIHNAGIHQGKDIIFKFNETTYKLIKNNPKLIPNHNDMILMYEEVVDIYANILSSIKDINVNDFIRIDINEETLTIFKVFITDYFQSNKEELSKEAELLTINNLTKITLDEEKSKKILIFLNNIHNKNLIDQLLEEVLSADLEDINYNET